jgi:hypothetical protein
VPDQFLFGIGKCQQILPTLDYEKPQAAALLTPGIKDFGFSQRILEIQFSNLYHGNEFQEGGLSPNRRN